MKIAYISVVRDDTDVFKYNIRYYKNIGVKDFYIMLHLPSKKLLSDTEDLKRELPECNFFFVVNNNEVHRYDENLKVLTDRAHKDGCTWMLPSDADELLILKKHLNIYDFISESNLDNNQYVSLLFSWRDYILHDPVPENENPFTFIKYIKNDYAIQSKCMAKIRHNAMFVPGAHYVFDCKNQIIIDKDVAEYVHFPYRNKKQYIDKIMMHKKNFMTRYGYYACSHEIDTFPNYLEDKFDNEIIVKELSEYNLSPLNKDLFE